VLNLNKKHTSKAINRYKKPIDRYENQFTVKSVSVYRPSRPRQRMHLGTGYYLVPVPTTWYQGIRYYCRYLLVPIQYQVNYQVE